MKKLFILCVLCLVSLTAHAQRFALLDFQLGTNVTTEEIDALTYNFRANFIIDGYRGIPRERINNTIETLGFKRTDMTRQQILTLSRELDAKLVVVGIINKFMDEYTVEVSALDVSTGLTCATEGDTFDKSSYRKAMETLADNLGNKLRYYGIADTITGNPSMSPADSDSGHKWVDLGLSVKWATCNVGATSPEEYGWYLAWGDTRPKNSYTWTNCPFRTNGDSDDNVTFSKYNTIGNRGTVDNRTRLELKDDAARANWGGTWRTPTDAEWTELREYCSWTWTTRNGVNGYEVRSLTNGNSIFLPAAGLRDGPSLYDAGSIGYYWSSSLDTDYPYRAWIVDFFSDTDFYSDTVYRYVNLRCYGRSVRPVSE